MSDPNIEWICNLKRKLEAEAESPEELRRIDELVDVYLEWYSLKNWTDWLKEAETAAKKGCPKIVEKERK